MKKIFTFAILLTLITVSVSAQVRGRIQDKTDSSTINAATVTLISQADSSEAGKTVSSPQGEFVFSGLSAGRFLIKVEALNYQEYLSVVNVTDSMTAETNILLDRQGKDLSTVTVIATAPQVIQKGDTAQFSASQYKVNPDATTEDLIKKMPGITVAKDGTVTAQGDQVRKVTIDGKDFFGDDASAALKNLPSEVVDKIQVFDRLSDQAQLTGFDDGNSVKAINIVTKSGIKNGQFGRAYAGYGTDDRYSAGGNVSFFKGNRRLSIVGNFNNINQQNFASQDLLGLTSSGGRGGNQQGGGGRGGSNFDNFATGQVSGISNTNALGINFGNQYGKKLTLTGSYFFNNSTNNNSSLVQTETFAKTGSGRSNVFSTQESDGTTKNTNHRINMRLEYKFDSSNSLSIIPNISFQNSDFNTLSSLKSYYSPTDSVNSSLNNIVSERSGYNIRNTILFRHAFPKKGRSLSFSLNTTFTKNDGETINVGNYRFFDTAQIIRDSVQNQMTDINSDGRTIGGTIAYTEPIGKKSQIQVDYSPSVQKNNSDQQTLLNDGQKFSILDPLQSNVFENTITTNNAGISYRFNESRDAGLSFGFNFQNSRLESDRIFPSVSKVDQSFSNILPNAMYRKKISTFGSVRLFYRASVNFPSVTQLQDVINTTSQLRATTGNPALQQSYTNFLSGRYTYTNTRTSKTFFANIFAQTAKDYITNAIYIAADDSMVLGKLLPGGSQLSKPVNLDGYKNLRTFFTYSQPLKFIKTNLTLSTGFGYSRLPGLFNNESTLTNNYTYNAGVGFASNISEFVDFNVTYNANFNNAKTTGASNSTNNYVNQSAGLQLNLLNKMGFFIQNDISYQAYNGISDELDQSYALWNAAIGKKFLKNRAGELKLSVFDLLKQNQAITRTVTGGYIEDAQTQVLQRYFLLTFTYNLKNFGTAKAAAGGNRQGGEGRPMQPGGPGF